MAELTGLQKFARELITAAGDGCNFDGGDIQELALKHGLVRVEDYSHEKHGTHWCDIIEEGEDIYCFNDVLERT